MMSAVVDSWGWNSYIYAIQIRMQTGDRLNIKMSSYQYGVPHVKDKTVSRPSYL